MPERGKRKRRRLLKDALLAVFSLGAQGCNPMPILQAVLQTLTRTGLVSGGRNPGSYPPFFPTPTTPPSSSPGTGTGTGTPTYPPSKTIGAPGTPVATIPGIDTNQMPLPGAQPFQTALGVPLYLPAQYAQGPRFVGRSEWDSNPPRSAWSGKPDRDYRSITIHHTSGGENDSLTGIKDYHQGKGWIDIGYHFLIRADGTIFEGTPLGVRGTHSAPNDGRIGVSLMGDFERSDIQNARYEPMRTSLQHLLAALHNAFPATKGHMRTHKDERGGSTDCPGRSVIAWLDGQWERSFSYRFDRTGLAADDVDAE